MRNWGKYNFFRGGKPVYDLMVSEMKNVKDTELLRYVYENYIENPNLNANVVSLFNQFFKENCTSHDESSTIRATIGGQEKEEEKEKEFSSSSSSEPAKTINDVLEAYKTHGYGELDEPTKEELRNHVNAYSIEWIMEAIREGHRRNKKTLKYLAGILNNWKLEGKITLKREAKINVTTLKYSRGKKNSFHNFEQPEIQYTNEELEDILRNKDK